MSGGLLMRLTRFRTDEDSVAVASSEGMKRRAMLFNSVYMDEETITLTTIAVCL